MTDLGPYSATVAAGHRLAPSTDRARPDRMRDAPESHPIGGCQRPITNARLRLCEKSLGRRCRRPQAWSPVLPASLPIGEWRVPDLAGEAFPGSPQQTWDLQMDPSHVAHCNGVFLWRLRGPLDVEAVTAAIGLIAVRHSVLRSRFCETTTGAMQIVAQDAPPRMSFTDLRAKRGAKRWRAVMATAKVELRHKRVLTRGVDFHTSLWQIGTDDFLLLVAAPHTAWDGFSTSVFIDELLAYTAADPVGSARPFPYQAWEIAQKDRESSRMPAVRAWRQRLQASAQAARKRPLLNPAIPHSTVEAAPVTLPSVVLERLAALARDTGVRTSAVALAAVWLLTAFSEQRPDQVIGVLYANRDTSEKRTAIGWLAEVVPLALEQPRPSTISDVIHRAGQALRDFRAAGITMGGLFPDRSRGASWHVSRACDVVLNYRPLPASMFTVRSALGYSVELVHFSEVVFATACRPWTGRLMYTLNSGQVSLAYDEAIVQPIVAAASLQALSDLLRWLPSFAASTPEALFNRISARRPEIAGVLIGEGL